MDARNTDRYCQSCGARLASDNRQPLCAPCQKKAPEAARRPPHVPPEFWEVDLIRDALATWHVGRVVQAYRHHPFHGRALSQEMVARWLGITQTQLSRVESGPPVKDLGRLIHWAKVFQVPSHLLWFKLPGERAGRQQPTAGSSKIALLSTPPSMLSPLGPQVGLPPSTYGITEGVRDAPCSFMWGSGAATGPGKRGRRRPGRRPGPGTAAPASDATPTRWPDARSTAPPARAAPPARG